MALSSFAVVTLKEALGNSAAGQEIATLVNTHGAGTLSTRTKRVIRDSFGSRADGNSFITAVEASSALSASDLAKLGVTLASRRAAALIAAELIV